VGQLAPEMYSSYRDHSIITSHRHPCQYGQALRVWYFVYQKQKGRVHVFQAVTTHLMLFSEHLPMYASCMMISGGRTEKHVLIDFGELAAVD